VFETLAPVPPGANEDSSWSPPPTAATWGRRGPAGVTPLRGDQSPACRSRLRRADAADRALRAPPLKCRTASAARRARRRYGPPHIRRGQDRRIARHHHPVQAALPDRILRPRPAAGATSEPHRTRMARSRGPAASPSVRTAPVDIRLQRLRQRVRPQSPEHRPAQAQGPLRLPLPRPLWALHRPPLSNLGAACATQQLIAQDHWTANGLKADTSVDRVLGQSVREPTLTATSRG
jgi:hypothetical protein